MAALRERVEELSRRWAIAMLRERPLAALAEVPLERLALLAPGLCTQLVQALAAEQEPAASGELQALASDWDAAGIVANVEALRGVIWEAVLEELSDPTARQVAELGDRLALLCAELVGAALAEDLTRAPAPAQAPDAAAPMERAQILYRAPRSTPGRRGAVLVNEREETLDPRAQPVRRASEPHPSRAFAPTPEQANAGSAGQAPQAAAASSSRAAARPLPWDTPLQPSGVPPANNPTAPPSVTEQGREAELRITRGRLTPVDKRS